MMSDRFTPLERDVLTMLLVGDDPVREALRAQLKVASVASREMTGVGFYTEIHVDQELSAKCPELEARIGNVEADVFGLQNGVGFMLWIHNGYLATLEAYTFEEPWPSDATRYSLKHITGLS